MILRRWLAAPAVASAALAAGLTGCDPAPRPTNTPSAASNLPGAADRDPDVGPPLYAAAAAPPAPKAPPGGGRDPIVLANCTVQYEDRQQVGAEVDGKIELIATPIAPGEQVDPKDVIYHPREGETDPAKKVPYRRLKDGDPVKVGQVLCFLDDQLVDSKKRQAVAMKAASSEVKGYAEKGVKLSEEKYALSKAGFDRGGIPAATLVDDQLTLSRFLENLAQAKQAIAKADADYEEAMVTLGKHRVVSHVNGFIRSIARQPGEFVKQGEKIMELQATDKVRVEGNLDVQYANLVRRGSAATVEPATSVAPDKSAAAHRQEVTGVAVAALPGRPLAVSASADGSAIVWDVVKERGGHNLPHPVGVRSVACTPPTAPHVRCITGGDDGRVRLWDLSNPDQLPTAPLREAAEAHASGVQAVAFSPDGRHFASAAGREVSVWETESGKRLYALPAEHRDTVTAVHFTPQATLVTASKDRTIKVWKLGADRAAVARSLDYRAGTVEQLDVSRDGGRVLFDQDRGRVDVVNLADKQTLGQVENTGATAAFATLALFSPDDQYVVTAGGEGEMKGGLQVWTTPAPGGRGSEVARLITPGRVTVTCGAFSPVKDVPFLVAGTAAGTVHLWKPPGEDARKKITGTVTKVDSTDPRYVTVRVEMDNRQLGLLDRSAATVVVEPSAPK